MVYSLKQINSLRMFDQADHRLGLCDTHAPIFQENITPDLTQLVTSKFFKRHFTPLLNGNEVNITTEITEKSVKVINNTTNAKIEKNVDEEASAIISAIFKKAAQALTDCATSPHTSTASTVNSASKEEDFFSSWDKFESFDVFEDVFSSAPEPVVQPSVEKPKATSSKSLPQVPTTDRRPLEMPCCARPFLGDPFYDLPRYPHIKSQQERAQRFDDYPRTTKLFEKQINAWEYFEGLESEAHRLTRIAFTVSLNEKRQS